MLAERATRKFPWSSFSLSQQHELFSNRFKLLRIRRLLLGHVWKVTNKNIGRTTPAVNKAASGGTVQLSERTSAPAK